MCLALATMKGSCLTAQIASDNPQQKSCCSHSREQEMARFLSALILGNGKERRDFNFYVFFWKATTSALIEGCLGIPKQNPNFSVHHANFYCLQVFSFFGGILSVGMLQRLMGSL